MPPGLRPLSHALRPSAQCLHPRYVKCTPLLRLPASRRAMTTPARPMQFGQPTHETHPHLLRAGEVTPNITSMEYAVRRAKLASLLPANSVAIIPSALVQYRSEPVFYDFHQDPDFYYLTGFLEPESVCVIEKTGPEGQHKFHMFVREKTPHSELWEGARSGIEAAKEVFNADEAYPLTKLQTELDRITQKASTIYVNYPNYFTSPTIWRKMFGPHSGLILKEIASESPRKKLAPFMHQLRIFKSPAELVNMRMAGHVTGQVFNEAIKTPLNRESDLAGLLDYGFRVGGCEKSAYVPVVAGGQNALSIHYTRNDAELRDGEMVLVDAGGQYGGYISDCSRTWPVNGKFTAAQRDLYEAVLTVQRKCVKLCYANSDTSLDQIHQYCERELGGELQRLGFDLGARWEKLGQTLFPHHLGHHIGLDVHDCKTYGRTQKLLKGQCVTVEPGVYVPDDEAWPKHFRGMGIRIEDSVYVDTEGPIVLTADAVKEVVDIEALRDK